MRVVAYVLIARLTACVSQTEIDFSGEGVNNSLALLQTRAARHTARAEVERTVSQFPNDKFTAWGSPHGGSDPVAILGIGFQKCATTFANNLLHKHPEVVPGNNIVKEKHYFDSGVEWKGNCKSGEYKSSGQAYKNYIDECFSGTTPGDGNQFRATVDISPTYAVFDAVPSRVSAMKGDVSPRFLAFLRDPRDRLISMCNMERRAPAERRNKPGKVPYKATSEEMGKLIQLYLRSRREELKSGSFAAYQNLERAGFEGDINGHIARGEYHHWLTRWTSHFPKESLLVVNYAHVDDDTTWQRIYQHTGLSLPADSAAQRKAAAHESQSHESKNKGSVAPVDVSNDVKKEISDYYDEHDAHLWKMLGSSWW